MFFLNRRTVVATLASLALTGGQAAADPSEIRIDWATYNPVSVVLKERGLLEEALKSEGVSVRWVQSAGSNKGSNISTPDRSTSARPQAPPL